MFVCFQAHFAQMRAPVGMLPLPAMPGFHLGAARFSPQQLYFGQVGPVMPPQAVGYGFQQQHVPGVRAGPPNFVMPFRHQRQGPPGQHVGPRRVGNTQHQQQACHCFLNLYLFIFLFFYNILMVLFIMCVNASGAAQLKPRF